MSVTFNANTVRTPQKVDVQSVDTDSKETENKKSSTKAKVALGVGMAGLAALGAVGVYIATKGKGKNVAQDLGKKAGDAVQSVKDKAGDVAQAVKNKAGETAQAVKDKDGNLLDKTDVLDILLDVATGVL